jgi:hypothetical protein
MSTRTRKQIGLIPLFEGVVRVRGTQILIRVALFSLLAWTSGPLAQAQRYQPGDVVEDFTLINRATGNPIRLSDYAGKIVFLEWFAWW